MLFKVLVPTLLLIGVGIITGVSVVVSQRPPPGTPGTTPVTPPSAAAASSSSSRLDTPAAATPASTTPTSSSGGGASPTSTPAPLPTPLDALLLPTIPTFTPEEKFAFQAKMDWDLDNVGDRLPPSRSGVLILDTWLTRAQNHTIQTNAGIQCSWWAREYVSFLFICYRICC